MNTASPQPSGVLPGKPYGNNSPLVRIDAGGIQLVLPPLFAGINKP